MQLWICVMTGLSLTSLATGCGNLKREKQSSSNEIPMSQNDGKQKSDVKTLPSDRTTGGKVWDPVWNPVWNPVWDPVWNPVWNPIPPMTNEEIFAVLEGSHFAIEPVDTQDQLQGCLTLSAKRGGCRYSVHLPSLGVQASFSGVCHFLLVSEETGEYQAELFSTFLHRYVDQETNLRNEIFDGQNPAHARFASTVVYAGKLPQSLPAQPGDLLGTTPRVSLKRVERCSHDLP